MPSGWRNSRACTGGSEGLGHAGRGPRRNGLEPPRMPRGRSAAGSAGSTAQGAQQAQPAEPRRTGGGLGRGAHLVGKVVDRDAPETRPGCAPGACMWRRCRRRCTPAHQPTWWRWTRCVTISKPREKPPDGRFTCRPWTARRRICFEATSRKRSGDCGPLWARRGDLLTDAACSDEDRRRWSAPGAAWVRCGPAQDAFAKGQAVCPLTIRKQKGKGAPRGAFFRSAGVTQRTTAICSRLPPL